MADAEIHIQTTCSVDSCERQRYKLRDLCNAHYQRLSRFGSTLPDVPIKFHHGMSNTSTYRIWALMIRRCTSPVATEYENYGGRGIRVCDRWRESFLNFLEDMGERPPGLQIERLNNDGHYEPSNCKWETRSHQIANRRRLTPTKSGYRGVALNHGHWEARIRCEKTTFYIGASRDRDEAAWMYDQWALSLHGEFAYLNLEYVSRAYG